ncbi:MAG: OmpA family protein [Proteobacteria bacterium]|nr:OmpA family protein [Pseudomonadota bacterium]MBU1688641.1 OmpA family protein [Pseudomonadota bacterium]
MIQLVAALVLLLQTGCATEGSYRYVDHNLRTHTVKPDSGFSADGATQSGKTVQYVAGEGNTVRYVARDGEIIRITPEEPVESAPSTMTEELAPEDAALRAAGTDSALLEAFIDQNAPSERAFVAFTRLLKPYIDQRAWDGATSVLSRYGEKFPDMVGRFAAVNALVNAPETGITIRNLGAGINSGDPEYNPVISSDEKTLYFARDCGECLGGEDIYMSRRDVSGIWAKAARIGSSVNTSGHEIPLGISADGTVLSLFGNYTESLGRGDIFHVDKTPSGWSSMNHYPAPINSEYFESNAVYTADGKAIFFISERPGGIGEYHAKGEYFHGSYGGNTDIYVAVKGANDSFEVINLGSAINTPYSEYSPFLHPDGKTLYFSSDGHPGLGGLDVFKTTRLSDTSWTEWSVPVNLGKEINTAASDWGYQVATSGEKVYFAVSDRANGFGQSDLYTVELPPAAKPSTVITIIGTVTDPSGKALPEATVRWNDLTLQKEIGVAKTDPQSGEYVIHFPVGGRYGYYAEYPGYIGQSEYFDLSDDLEYREFALDIVLQPIPKPVIKAPEPKPVAEVLEIPEIEEETVASAKLAPIRMNNIFFEFNKAELLQESYMELERWVRFMKENQGIRMQIFGNADNVGTDEYNQKLSEKRAKSVAQYLANQGIDLGRMEAIGYGESRPVASNDTEEGRQLNRRVEVKILSEE